MLLSFEERPLDARGAEASREDEGGHVRKLAEHREHDLVRLAVPERVVRLLALLELLSCGLVDTGAAGATGLHWMLGWNLKKNDDFETYLGPGGRNQRLNK